MDEETATVAPDLGVVAVSGLVDSHDSPGAAAAAAKALVTQGYTTLKVKVLAGIAESFK